MQNLKEEPHIRNKEVHYKKKYLSVFELVSTFGQSNAASSSIFFLPSK